MELIERGHGNSSDFIKSRNKALREKTHLFIISIKNGGIPGVIGSSFNYEIRGANSTEELLNRDILGLNCKIFASATCEEIEKRELAKRYLRSLTDVQRTTLIDEMLEKYLVGAL